MLNRGVSGMVQVYFEKDCMRVMSRNAFPECPKLTQEGT